MSTAMTCAPRFAASTPAAPEPLPRSRTLESAGSRPSCWAKNSPERNSFGLNTSGSTTIGVAMTSSSTTCWYLRRSTKAKRIWNTLRHSLRINGFAGRSWAVGPSGGSPREGAQSTPKRGSPRGVGSEARAELRLAAGGAAPPTRLKCASSDAYQFASCSFDFAFGQKHAHTPDPCVEKILGQMRIASKRRVLLAVQRDLADHPARRELVVARRVATGDGVVAIRAFRPRAP